MIKLNTVHEGDCLVLMQEIPDKSINLILTDLPYQLSDCEWDTLIPFDKLWSQYNRIITDNGAVVLTSQQPFTTDLINSNRKQFRYEWVWVKNRKTNFANAKKQPMRSHEVVLVFSKKQSVYNPQGLVELKKPKHISGKKVGEAFRISDLQQNYVQTHTGYPNSILNFDCVNKTIHPTEKPVALFEYMVKTYTNAGDTVLDSCAGSGVTGEAINNINASDPNSKRNFILIEKEAKYVELIKKRLRLP